MDDESPTERLKNWIVSVVVLTAYFSVAGVVGWMRPYDAGISILGCSLGMAALWWIGPQKLAHMSSGTQLVPWLPPPAPSLDEPNPAEVDRSIAALDPASVPTYYRIWWTVSRWVIIVVFAPLWLPILGLRKLIDWMT